MQLIVKILFYLNVFIAPKKPSVEEVNNKILPQNDSEVSTDMQYVISIDLSLFSNDYGIVKEYFIYVRQSKNHLIFFKAY